MKRDFSSASHHRVKTGRSAFSRSDESEFAQYDGRSDQDPYASHGPQASGPAGYHGPDYEGDDRSPEEAGEIYSDIEPCGMTGRTGKETAHEKVQYPCLGSRELNPRGYGVPKPVAKSDQLRPDERVHDRDPQDPNPEAV